ncbi:MAG: S41 family peptidase [Paramuribaculum sp.]|nr:S41 family peptidase [Paramuribaculum sp.]
MKKTLLIIILALTCIGMTEGRSRKSKLMENMRLFSSVVKEVEANYVDTIDIDAAVKTAINAMLRKLDPYTEYLAGEEQEDFKVLNQGEYGGIGSYVVARDGNVYISGPYKGSPAQKAGLRHGDLIMVVNGDSVLGMTTDEVTSRLKGPQGTNVVVTVKRPYTTDSIITVRMVREKITIPSVPYYGVISDNIGYILLTGFSEKSADEVKTALETLVKHDKIKGLILDLRDNGGGYLESAVKILGYFLPKGTEVLRTRGRNSDSEKIYRTHSKPIAPSLPLVVLINGNTASSAEITAGALQDLDRAVIVGNRSFGKGLVQTPFDLPNNGMLKVTISKYYLPSGRLIQSLDYSHRAADGSVNRIPDSLTTVYTTKIGREVRDGGGITPDSTVTYPEISRVTYNLVADNWIFDYANKYRASHPTLPPVREFVITDSIYADFKAGIDPDKFNHDNVCDMLLTRLRDAAKIEGYLTDSLSAQLDIVKSLLRLPLDEDLDTNRSMVTPYLKREIADRYYFREGEIESVIDTDPAIIKAMAIITDPKLYSAILSAPDKK